MWETSITCEACDGTHRICADSIPRAFEYDCPSARQRVHVPFRDPARMPEPWTEVARASAGATRALAIVMHGRLEL
ncbi:MAG: hypothetical protein ACI8QZ_003418 [Chlamydiales bacterium]|jgi:hypothetical protein